MPRVRCDRCGETFASEMNLRYHRQLVDCDGDDEVGSSDEGGSETGPSDRPVSPTSVATDATGTVQTFDDDRGYGFVTTADVTSTTRDGDERTEDVFVHVTDVAADRVERGDRLRFDVVETDRGLRCVEATVIERAADRDTEGAAQDDPVSRLGFGRQRDDEQYGRDKPQTPKRHIESFRDERKFR